MFRQVPLRSPHTIGLLHYPGTPGGPPTFRPIVQRNHRLGDDCTASMNLHNPEGKWFQATVAERRHELNLESADSYYRSLSQSEEDAEQIVSIRNIRIDGLRLNATERARGVRFSLDYEDEDDIRLVTQIGPRSVTVSLFKSASIRENST